MNLFQLPASLILAIFTHSDLIAASPAPVTTATKGSNRTTVIATTGSGPQYASACQSAISSYDSASASWDRIHNIVSNTTLLLGGTSWSSYTVYENATTLCDGRPRLTYSPAVSISNGTSIFPGRVTGTTTIMETYGSIFPEPSPMCSIKPTDCDPLWVDYTKSLSSAATITPAPSIATPPCLNSSEASSYEKATEKVYGCGKCTIYGQGVELVYFPVPTTVSRNMCTDAPPTDALTHYGKGAVITAYAGTEYKGPGGANGSQTAVVDGHTFTSGTAYISIKKVFAADRCSHTRGVVTDAILAMPSQSVLSLRYRQDHFQALMETDKITGYPIQYADFNTPIPWSAWNGQNLCQGPWDEAYCGIIYENNFRPQLAIPPEITALSPDFEGCQMWYNGLWDPPLRLTEHQAAAKPTLPNAPGQTTTPASPSSHAAAPTIAPTAIPNELPTYTEGGSKSTYPADKPSSPASHSPENAPSIDKPHDNNPHDNNPHDNNPHNNNPHNNNLPDNNPPDKNPHDNNPHDNNPHDNSPHDNNSHNNNLPDNNLPDNNLPDNNLPDNNLPDNNPHDYNPHDNKPHDKNPPSKGQPSSEQGKPSQGAPTRPQNGPSLPKAQGSIFDVKTTIRFDKGPAATGGSLPENGPKGNSVSSEGGSNNIGYGPATIGGSPRSEDSDTVAITLGGHIETVVQSHDGGPIIIGKTVTITPGGAEATVHGQIVSAVTDGLVLEASTTLGVDAKETDASSTGTSQRAIGTGSKSGASGSGHSDAVETSSTGSGSFIGAASRLTEGVNVAAVFAILIAAIAG